MNLFSAKLVSPYLLSAEDTLLKSTASNNSRDSKISFPLSIKEIEAGRLQGFKKHTEFRNTV